MRDFHLGDILSVTTRRLVSPRGMDGIYDILGYMTGETLFTHQLPRAGDECAGPLLDQHPALADVRVPDDFASETVEAWRAAQVARFGERLPVSPLGGARARPDPLPELLAMIPAERAAGIVIVPEEGT